MLANKLEYLGKYNFKILKLSDNMYGNMEKLDSVY
jgi:hypothetical protein